MNKDSDLLDKDYDADADSNEVVPPKIPDAHMEKVR